MTGNMRFQELVTPITGLAPVVPSSSVPDYVSMKGHSKLGIVITVKNATTVTGSAITLKQATAVANTGEKALAFDTVYVNTDTAASDTLVETAVTSNTFTTNNTNSKDLLYVITVDAASLDLANNYDCVRVGTGDATAATVSVMYFLYPPKYGKNIPVTAITD